jgi:hypothetical protein
VANLNQEELRRLTRLGAVARLQELRREEDAIRAEFPELFGGARGGGRGRGRRRAAGAAAATTAGAGRKARRKRSMSAAQRKAVSERMRKYWADRRKAKGNK